MVYDLSVSFVSYGFSFLMSELSIGNELKDSFKNTSKWVNNGINWLGDIEEFYRERATLEKEYADKLRDMCKRHFDKKLKHSSLLSVGDEPQITPGSLESASLVLWTDVLTQTEAIARERSLLHSEITTKVCANLATLKHKLTTLFKQIERINEYLLNEKKLHEEEVTKAKKHYDSLCALMELAREKAERSSSEKHQSRLHDKEVDMNVGKNDYLIRIAVANRLKDKYFYQDLPEVLDYLQELNETRVGLTNKILQNAGIIERNANDRVKEKLYTIDHTIERNNPSLDTLMFIKHNVCAWKEPQDFYFVPCSIWHDDESLVVREPELTDLKRRLDKASTDYARLESACLDNKQRLEELALERKTDNVTLKFDTKFSSSLNALQNFMKNDTLRVQSEVEIEVIQNFAGDADLLYVEQESRQKSRFGLFKRKSVKRAETDAHSTHTVASTPSTVGLGVFNLRKKAQSIMSGHSNTSTLGTSAKALYAYAATGDDEASVHPGDALVVLEEDTGSGWTQVQVPDGSQGLVPTSYIEITKKAAPPVAPKRGAKRVQYVEALYDYAADGDDELTILAGDRIVLVQDDLDGSGWTEGELNGLRGMFPTSYVKKV